MIYEFNAAQGRIFERGDANGSALLEYLADYNFDLQSQQIEVEGQKITLHGDFKDQSQLERIVLLLGNLQSIAIVDCDDAKLLTKPNSNKQTRFYKIEPRQSLWSIAKEIYGENHGDKYKIIYEANQPMLKSPDDLFIGQIIRIPNIDLIM